MKSMLPFECNGIVDNGKESVKSKLYHIYLFMLNYKWNGWNQLHQFQVYILEAMFTGLMCLKTVAPMEEFGKAFR